MWMRLPVAALLALRLTASDYADTVQKWRQEREASLKSAGWLALALRADVAPAR